MNCLLSERIRSGAEHEGGRTVALKPARMPARESGAHVPWAAIDRLRPGWLRRARLAGIARDDAEDLFQEALLASLQGLDRLRPVPGRSLEEAFAAWFCGILRHKLISEVRRRKRHRRYEERVRAAGGPSEPGLAATRVRSSLGLLQRTSPEAVRILRRRFLDGWELREMARDLGVSVPTACRRVQAALAEIRACMDRNLV